MLVKASKAIDIALDLLDSKQRKLGKKGKRTCKDYRE